MAISRGFPQRLLKATSEEKLAYFRQYTLRHRRLQEAYETLLDIVREPGDAVLAYVFGPTGVGKTTLLLRTEQEILSAEDWNAGTHRGRLPVVRLEAIAPDTGNYSWRAFYREALHALEDAFIDRGYSPYNGGGHYPDNGGRPITDQPRTSTEILRHVYETALQHRRPAAVLIDEAQHLTMVSAGRKLKDQMEVVKSLASRTNTLHVLVGTYDLLHLLNRNGQLACRSAKIHLPRYHADSPEDIQEFINVIGSFQYHLPLKKEPDLIAHWEDLFERSLGCVGILKTWLTKALYKALQEKAETLTAHHLEKCALLPDELNELRTETRESESELLLRAQAVLSAKPQNPEKPAHGASRPTTTAKPKKGRVGQRKPLRDPIGTRPKRRAVASGAAEEP